MEVLSRSEWMRTPMQSLAWGHPWRFRGWSGFLLQCSVGVLLTFVLTGAGLGLALNLSTTGLLYLLLVVFISVRCGFWQASVVSIVALACQTYFFVPPSFSFYIADPRNFISIVIFEVAALVVSGVSSREKRHAQEKDRERETMERLYTISRHALLLEASSAPEQEMATVILREFHPQSVAILDRSHTVAGIAGGWAAHQSYVEEYLDQRRPTSGIVRRPILCSEGEVGLLLVEGEVPPLAMDSLASLVALTMERHRAFVNESAAEAARQTEQLRSTVLDGLAHAFKTPLTIIRAASSGLLEIGRMTETQRQLTGMIDEQSMRLDDLATRLLRTARIDGQKLCLQSETIAIRNLIEEVVSDFRTEWPGTGEAPQTRLTIHVAAADQDLEVIADHDMISSTLKELLTNAAKYSPPDSPILVSASASSRELLISVHNQGSVIRISDRERIFDRFYRGEDHRHSAPGSGIGLSVARRVTEAHGGQIWVASNEEEGTTFSLSLPKRKTPAADQNF